jgi:hypothetical protein
MCTRRNKINKILLLTFVGFLLSASAAYSINLESIDVKGGMIWIGNEIGDAAPSPLTTILGVSLPIRFTSFFALEPELRYYGLPYGVEHGRPVPVEIEFARWAWVLGFILEPRAVFDFQIVDTLTLSPYVSPTFLFRIPARAWGVNLGDESAAFRREIASYQYGMGRFFYPEVGLIVDWEIPFRNRSPEVESFNEGEFSEEKPNEGIEIHIVVDLNVYFPLFHAWDDEERKFYDQFMTSGVVGIRVFFPTPKGASLDVP